METETTAEQAEQVEVFKSEDELKFFKIKRDSNGNFITFIIDRLNFIRTIQSLGFRRYDVDRSHIFICIKFGIVREVTITEIIDTFFDYLKTKYKDPLGDRVDIDMLISHMYAGLGHWFNEKLMYRLEPDRNLNFLKDDKNHKFIFYSNSAIQISASGFKQIYYNDIAGYIWNNELLGREFKRVSGTSYFERFCLKVCNNDDLRLKSLKTILGYIMHSYYETKLQAVLLTDSRISDDDEPNGRTGKTLLCKALSFIINPVQTMKTFCELNGKDFDSTNRYKFQDCHLNTKVIVINDVRKNYNIENHFNDITEGITVEQKNKQPFRIWSKMVFVSNKTIKINGESAKDRVIEFEFGEYFNSSRSPYKEFGHWFFRDWNADEWSRFDLFMINCIQLYMKEGIILPEVINLNRRKLNEETNKDFVEFMEGLFIKDGDKYDKKALYDKFREQYSDFMDPKFKQARFSKWLQLYTRYHDDFIELTKADESRSDDKRFVVFKKVRR